MLAYATGRAESPVSHRLFARAVGLVLLAGALVLAALLATGSVLVVETHGVSMLPSFRTGDLAFVLARPSYHVGEVVAYSSSLLHVTVLHRIVAEHAGRFTFKGDNNHFLDPLRLPATAIRGSLWFKVPDPGGWLQFLETRRWAAVSGIVSVLALGGLLGHRRARRAGARRAGARRQRPSDARLWTSSILAAAAAPLAVAAVAGAFYAVALARPAAHRVAHPIAVRQAVAFRYGASVPVSTVYPAGKVETGMPVFSRLVQTLDVGARYRFRARGARKLHGTITLGATFVSSNGWSQSLGGVGPEHFRGPTASLRYHLDLVRAEALLQTVSSESGAPVGAATIVVRPHVRVAGTVEGITVSRHDAPPLVLDLTPSEVVPAGVTSSNALPHYAQLHASSSSPLTTWADAPSQLRLLGHPVSVATVRADALRVMTAALVAALLAALVVLARLRAGEARQIRARYRRELVEVASPPEAASQPVIDVASISALAHIAEAAQTPLLHYGADGSDRYFALQEGALYRYRVGRGDAGGPPAQRPRGAHLKGATRAS